MRCPKMKYKSFFKISDLTKYFKYIVLSFFLSILFCIPYSNAQEISPVFLEGVEFSYIDSDDISQKFETNPVHFYRHVGGVAFRKIAQNSEGWHIENMSYDNNKVDGQRLTIYLKKNRYLGLSSTKVKIVPKIYDWQLIPLAHFVASDAHSAFTYFGTYQGRKSIYRNKVVSYHPALKNTLIGLRLMHLDMLLVERYGKFFSGYIRDQENKIILGSGEPEELRTSEVNFFKENERYKKEKIDKNIFEILDSFREDSWVFPNLDAKWKSYVVGDFLSPIFFRIKHDKLMFSNNLCWDFWRDYKGNSDYYLQGLKVVENEEDRITRLVNFSSVFCEHIDFYQGLHPLVYETSIVAMNFTAIYRRFKEDRPKIFKQFVKSFDSVTLSPSVLTPTVIGLSRK